MSTSQFVLYGTGCTIRTVPTPGKSDIRLTSTSYLVLGMLDWLGPSTPYRLKRVMAESVEDFFPVPHTSFYAEPARLAAAGYLAERTEQGGRRRRTFELTARGREALAAWLEEPETRFGEFRFPGMLKVFFGADPSAFAPLQARHHAQLAERFEAVRAAADRGEVALPPQRRKVLQTGIALHRWWEARWKELGEASLLE
jgi:DNA-binding PadR family transcriptional regulator